MAENTFTPGPWRVCRDGDCTCGFVWSACGEIHVASVHGPESLGQDYYGSDVATLDAPANARLIASAPDLLEALEDMLPAFRSATPGPAYRGLKQRAELAIARARGDA